ISYLFFTDIVEANFTVTVDPNAELPKGMGLVNATSLFRLVGSTYDDTTLRYCGNTSYVQYQINGPDEVMMERRRRWLGHTIQTIPGKIWRKLRLLGSLGHQKNWKTQTYLGE
ncbi:hypothetical protein SK128_011128, partial [Halocaridina rubra]